MSSDSGACVMFNVMVSRDGSGCAIHDAMVCVCLQAVTFVRYMMLWCLSTDDGVCMVHEAMVCVYLQMVVFV